MERDATSAGVKNGGLFSTADIKVLVCYLLTSIDEPIPANMLANMLHYEGLANAFEVSDAIFSLAKSGHILQADAKEDSYIIAQSGRNVAHTLNDSLSLTVKERALSASLKMLTRYRNSREVDFKITHEEAGTFITCTALDGKRPFMSIKLMVADETQAQYIKDRFLDNSAKIFSTVIDLMTK